MLCDHQKHTLNGSPNTYKQRDDLHFVVMLVWTGQKHMHQSIATVPARSLGCTDMHLPWDHRSGPRALKWGSALQSRAVWDARPTITSIMPPPCVHIKAGILVFCSQPPLPSRRARSPYPATTTTMLISFRNKPSTSDCTRWPVHSAEVG
jgi:hypothetical protein